MTDESLQLIKRLLRFKPTTRKATPEKRKAENVIVKRAIAQLISLL